MHPSAQYIHLRLTSNVSSIATSLLPSCLDFRNLLSLARTLYGNWNCWTFTPTASTAASKYLSMLLPSTAHSKFSSTILHSPLPQFGSAPLKPLLQIGSHSSLFLDYPLPWTDCPHGIYFSISSPRKSSTLPCPSRRSWQLVCIFWPFCCFSFLPFTAALTIRFSYFNRLSVCDLCLFVWHSRTYATFCSCLTEILQYLSICSVDQFLRQFDALTPCNVILC